MLRPTVSRPVCLGVKPHLGPKNRFLLLSGICALFDVGHPLWRKDVSAVCHCCWPSLAQLFMGPSPAGLMNILLSQVHTPPTWKAGSPYLYPLGMGWPTYTPRDWAPFSSPPTTRRAAVEVFEPASIRVCLLSSQSQSYVTTDGQSASLSWNKSPIWGFRPDIYYCMTFAGLLMWGALSDERTSLSYARVTVSSNKSVLSMYNIHFTCY
jgi:hypothetical protein